jgi:serine/threonine-protein kinase
MQTPKSFEATKRSAEAITAAEPTSSAELSTAPKPGDLIAEKLRVERVIGEGGMGLVVAAEHIHLRQRVAVKLLRGEVASMPTVVERFLREARAMAALRGQNVVRVADVGTMNDGLPYMVMEYLSGRDLGEVLGERGRLSVADATDYVLQACEGLAEAHGIGIVHRDLKPSNLFLTRRSDGGPLVKVLDFGVSKLVDAKWDEKSLTDTSTIVGSPAYMSPEQIRSSKTVDARTDIWSLGVCLFKLVTGELPFASDTGAGLCAAIVLGEHPPSLREKAPEVPPAFDAVVMRCMTKSLEKRFQTVAELASALRPFATPDGRASADRVIRRHHADAVTVSEIVPPSAVLPRSNATAKIAVAAVLFAVLASIVTMVAMRREHAPVSAPASASTETAARAIPPPMPLPSLSAFVPASASASSKPATSVHPQRPSQPSDDQLIEQRR